jgi:hypothetical protein
VRQTDGRISAHRLLPLARAGGYAGSDRNFRRLVAEVKNEHRRTRRGYRPWVPVPGAHLVIDWGQEGDLRIVCAVLAWSRWRFVRVARDERRDTTLSMIASCLSEAGAVPEVVLSDRMAALTGSVVAGVVAPSERYLAIARHYGFRPDFCEAGDPESKGVVENLVGYAKRDLIVPQMPFADLGAANEAARAWCDEVNERVHPSTGEAPAERLSRERAHMRALPAARLDPTPWMTRTVDRTACVSVGAARYSVPERLVGRRVEVLSRDEEVIVRDGDEIVARHLAAPAGAVVTDDSHYRRSGPRPDRRPRPRTKEEIAICALGDVGVRYLAAAAAAGTTRLSGEARAIAALEQSYGREALSGALSRAIAHRRFRARDVRAILDRDGPGSASPGSALDLGLPAVGVRSLDSYRARSGRAA